ncbi:hypothetical protein VTN00DRAFT_9652 [Thermoascus crustaceus]|uniref:uncharacterized protein n=1 Tax=Thermoascus crustaceus TaxID=5088 RepID=UPI003742113D
MAGPDEMADVKTTGTKRPALDIESLQRKKFKTSELPLSAAQRAAIDNLLYTFKKRGDFDNVRKTIWAEFNEGEAKTSFVNSLIELAESEIEREPALLSRERGKAATLIEGAVDRSDIYKNVESSLEELTSKHLESILNSIRNIRREEVGEEVAVQEERSGNKTDEDFDRHVKAKREERERVYQEELLKQREKEEEEARARAEEERKQRELQRQREEERAKEREREEKRRAERERIREEQRLLEEQREREREERYERRRREERERYRDRDRDRYSDRDRDRYSDRYSDRDRSRGYDRGVSPRYRDSRRDRSPTPKDPTPPPPPPPPVDDKSLEEAALQMLLKEGEELAAKSRQKPEFDFEEAEAIESGRKPPPPHPATTIDEDAKEQRTGTIAHGRGDETTAGAALAPDATAGVDPVRDAITAAAAPVRDAHLDTTVTVDAIPENGPERHQPALVTGTGTVTAMQATTGSRSATTETTVPPSTRTTEAAAAAEAGLPSGAVIGTETEIPATGIAAVTATETTAVTVDEATTTVTTHALALALALDPGPGPDPDLAPAAVNARAPVPAPVPYPGPESADDPTPVLPPDEIDGLAPAAAHPPSSISTGTSRPRATGADRHGDGSGLPIVIGTIGPGMWRSIGMFLGEIVIATVIGIGIVTETETEIETEMRMTGEVAEGVGAGVGRSGRLAI